MCIKTGWTPYIPRPALIIGVVSRILISALFVVSGWLLALGSRAPAVRPVTSAIEFDQSPYVVRALDTLASRYWSRVAGRDAGLPPHTNGHDEFASAWTQAVRANLRNLPVAVLQQSFTTPGFRHLPATRPGMNVVVAVPGTQHPRQAIVIGAHYDGEPTSRGSAYDDTSGSALILGLTRALGDIWRRDGLPGRTVEFILFDAEEQGLVGSDAYVFTVRQHALMPRPVLMIDEEQSGVGYPVRPFGLLSRQPLPSFAMIDGPVPSQFGRTVAPGPAGLRVLRQRLMAARPAVFRQLSTLYPTLPYNGGDAAAFTVADQQYLRIGPMSICCSDNVPFETLAVPTLTLSSDVSFYSRNATPWAYPFDQPLDTPQTLACDTGGTSRPGAALEAALALPLAISVRLLQDYAPPHSGSGIAVFSSVPVAGKATRFSATGSTRLLWDFGDGTFARGTSARHVYTRAGRYKLAVRAGAEQSSYWVQVHPHPLTFVSPLQGISPPRVIPWHPRALNGTADCP